MRKLRRTEVFLSSRMTDVDDAWAARFDPALALPHLFGPHVTGCIDTFPIYVSRPKDAAQQRALYAGKYGAHVVKVQVICNHRGAPTWYSALHVGRKHDLKVWKENRAPLAPGEQLLGDKAYKAEGGPFRGLLRCWLRRFPRCFLRCWLRCWLRCPLRFWLRCWLRCSLRCLPHSDDAWIIV